MIKLKNSKKKIYITMTLLIIFIFVNLSWFLLTYVRYNEFTKGLPRFGSILSYGTNVDGYNYHVKKPNYLSFTGNLAVSNIESGELLIIWPLVFGGYEYGLKIEDKGVGYEFYVDENMEIIDKEDIYSVKLLQDNKEKVENLLGKARQMWNLD